MHRLWLGLGALNMLIALIVAAAFGHRPEGEFVPVARATMDTAREMHFIHALALFAPGILTVQFGRKRTMDAAGWAFLAGIVLFCGGIYVGHGLSVAELRPLIPFGGVSFMAGWIALLAGVLSATRASTA